VLRFPCDEPGAKLTQDGMVEAGVGEVESQNIFPINAATDGIRGWAIREAFGKLEDGDQCQARRRFCGLAARRKEGGELRVMVDSAKAISHLHIHVPVWECGMGHPLGVFRDRIGSVGV
jgi:hypothetical protein